MSHLFFIQNVNIGKECSFCGESFSVSSGHWAIKQNKYLECKEHSKETRQDRRRKHNLKKYGTDKPKESKEFHTAVHKKRIETMKRRYGTDNAMRSQELKQKQQQSIKQKYGAKTPTQNKEVVKKIQETNLHKYGYTTNLQIPETIENRKKSTTNKLSTLLSDGTNIATFCEKRKVPMTWAYKVYKEGGEGLLKAYAEEYTKKINNLELLFIDIMKDFKEINLFNRYPSPVTYRSDFFLEGADKKLYVNIDDLYLHSEASQPDNEHHLKIRKTFENNQLRIMQFRSNELAEKGEIVRSLIKKYFGYSAKVQARNCQIQPIKSSEASNFLEKNHLAGRHPASKSFGLFHNNELIGCVSIRQKNKTIYIERYCNSLECSIVGGFSKALSFIIDRHSPEEVISYCDMRYGSGKSYTDSGFELTSENLGMLWTDGVNLFSKIYCRANMDERQLSENEYAIEMKLLRIFDAGQNKYTLRPKVSV
jgi:hypothetical protein